MRIAIFHNFLDNIGGAEIATLYLARELNADIYTTNLDHEKVRKMGFDSRRIISIGAIPTHAPFRQELAYWKFRQLNLGKRYDFYIIAGDWAMGAAVHNTPHLWYVFSPNRELWDLYTNTRQTVVPWHMRWLFDAWVHYRRAISRRDIRYVQRIVAISNVVRDRVAKYFSRDADVVYPPVDISKYRYDANGDFWLSVNRLISYKRIELQLEAFRQMPNEHLVIVGSYEQAFHFRRYAEHIRRMKPGNVEIVSWVDDRQLIDLYATCRGVISTSRSEDFGLTAIEAMASGKPIIAPNEGGYKETILDGKTGMLVSDITAERLADAIREIGKNPSQYREACLERAKLFSLDAFISQMRQRIDDALHQ